MSTFGFCRFFALLFIAALVAGDASAQWVEFADETGSRLSGSASVTTGDIDEKDYAWGDVDKDGDVDLVVVRKEPFTSPGKRTNVLFLNENGVLTERTADFAASSDVPGDQGFLTPTNDRDVLLVDLNGDTWLDIVTATTISDGDPKHIGHPRIYINQQEIGGVWQGFRHEDGRIPTMLSYSGQPNFNPRFCSVAAGDVTGDGAPDLWFGDYDSSGAGGFSQPSGADYNDRLLVNNGSGFFTDVTQDRFSGVIDIPGSTNTSFEVSAFGAAAAIADMDGDGRNDIIKQTSLQNPLYVGVAYNTPGNEGFFDTFEVVNNNSPYFISIDDLNNDGKLDIVITDDGADRYLLNQGNGPDGIADFGSSVFSYDAASDDGFGSNSLISDLNNDGWNDVLIADVDVDISGCNRRLHIYRNLAGQPGDSVILQEQTVGSGCATSQGNPASCLVASIPSNQLEGVHDMAIFDINDDGWKDMVLGRCGTTQVWMNQPPTGLTFSYPLGLPLFIEPGAPTTVQVDVGPSGVATPVAGSGRMFASINGAPFSELFLNEIVDNLYQAALPAVACTDTLEFYFLAKAAAGTFTDPPNAPAQTYTAVGAFGTVTSLEDGMEGDVSGWTVINDPSLTGGAWTRAQPNGTLTGGGALAAPEEDAEASQSAIFAFVTENGPSGAAAALSDVDGGPTDLISPVIDLNGTDATITYSRWFFSDGSDSLTVWVTADGSSWQLVETVSGMGDAWEVSSFKVGDFVTPSSLVQIRFRTSDLSNDSITEAGVDAFRVDEFACSSCSSAAECDDGIFCNGAEACTDNICVPSSDPCPGQACDESADSCVECLIDEQCDDGDYCNGVESCAGNSCVAGSDPCPGDLCDDVIDACVDCLDDVACDDGLFCNGAESCTSGVCTPALDACPGQLCDEGGDVCIGTVELQPRMGMPLLRLTAGEQARFEAGLAAFDTVFSEGDGLGPIFNQNACGACHSTPTGGSGGISVTHFGFNDDKGAGFDPLSSLGGSLRQSQAIAPECAEDVPPEANVTAQRITPSTLGFGLLEAIPGAAIEANALTPPAGVSGRAHMVPALEDPGPLFVGRFGWKSQVATVLTFSADALLNEMGITNRFMPQENAPNGDTGVLAICDTVADPEDGPDGEGFDFIDRVTDFQRYLAPPPQTPRSGMAGEALFNNVGCNSCHISTFTTADDPSLEDAIRDEVARPYSDFLLHDMGQFADFIEQGAAEARELRTPPLWGLRVRDPMWHDGSVAGGTFASRVNGAIANHDSLGSEAQSSAQGYFGLPLASRDALVQFLDSLGRGEFDHDGDNDVDAGDWAVFQACLAGPGSYSPNDVCAISDVDQNGEVDQDDYDLFLAASRAVASGAVPDGAAVPGSQLTVEPAAGGEITVSWDASCKFEDIDYEIYEGTIGDFSSHTSLFCSTAGATTKTFAPSAGGTYYLVVPTNLTAEGSYGAATGGERSQSAGACLPQAIEGCP